MKVHINVTCLVYPTEDKERVVQAMKNLVPFNGEPEIIEDKEVISLPFDKGIRYEVPVSYLSKKVEGHLCLKNFHRRIRDLYTVEATRRVLLESIKEIPGTGTTATISLNKQAAFHERVKISEEDDCAMGPITIEIVSDGDVAAVVEWLAPPTKKGVVLEPTTMPF